MPFELGLSPSPPCSLFDVPLFDFPDSQHCPTVCFPALAVMITAKSLTGFGPRMHTSSPCFFQEEKTTHGDAASPDDVIAEAKWVLSSIGLILKHNG